MQDECLLLLGLAYLLSPGAAVGLRCQQWLLDASITSCDNMNVEPLFFRSTCETSSSRLEADSCSADLPAFFSEAGRSLTTCY